MSSSQSHPAGQGSPALSPLRALLVLVGLVALLAGYIALCIALHLAAAFAGSLFLFFWLGVEKGAPAALAPTLVGAVGGIVNAGLLHPDIATAFGLDPGVSALSGLALLVIAVYILLIHKITVLFNQSYMLFVTVAGIPIVSGVPAFESMLQCLFLAAVYFGLIFWILRRIGRRRDLNAAARAIAVEPGNLDFTQPEREERR